MNKFTRLPQALALLGAAAMLGGCSALPFLPEAATPAAAQRNETLYAVSQDHVLLRLKASNPGLVLSRLPITGLAAGDQLVGIDFRVARGVLYALGSTGQLYTLDTRNGAASRVGAPLQPLPLAGLKVGFDFNPAADRIRVVADNGLNLRVHPDTGQQVDGDAAAPGLQGDAALHYANGDTHAGKAAQVSAAGYTYNKSNEKLSTNYAIDIGMGMLAMQGSHEGDTPAVSPNTGRLRTVGPLGVAGIVQAELDISDLKNTPLASLRTDRTRLYEIDLRSGHATLLGPLADGSPVRGIAIEP